jgi:hypothetical protein
MASGSGRRNMDDMTYSVVVAAKDKNVVVKVDAGDAYSAKEIAHWLVANDRHLEAQGVKEKTKETKER